MILIKKAQQLSNSTIADFRKMSVKCIGGKRTDQADKKEKYTEMNEVQAR